LIFPEEQRFVVKFLWLKGWESKTIHQEPISTFRDYAHRMSQIKIWLQRFRTEDLSCNDLTRAGPLPLTLGPQVEAFLQRYPFASARIIAKHFVTTVFPVKKFFRENWG
jgi:hypothetical protein